MKNPFAKDDEDGSSFNPTNAIIGGAVGGGTGALLGVASDELGKTDITGSKAKTKAAQDKARQAEDDATIRAKQDDASIANIDKKMTEAAGQTATQNASDIAKLTEIGGKGDKALETLTSTTKTNTDKTQTAIDALATLTGETDPRKLAATLVEQQAGITQQKMDLADQTIKNAEQMSKWSEGIATSYQDIGQRYMDAVTGLSSAEKQAMRGTATQDYAAMSAMGSAGTAAALNRGGAMTGMMASAMQGAGQRAATDSYSMAQDRMANIDEQRRQMQFSIVQSASQDERANRGLGANIDAQRFGMEAGARGQQAGYLQQGFDSSANMQLGALSTAFQQGSQTYQNTAAGINQMQGYGQNLFGSTMQNNQFQAGIVGQTGDLARDTIGSNFQAATYADEAGISTREGRYTEGMGRQNVYNTQKAGIDSGARQDVGLAIQAATAAGSIASGMPSAPRPAPAAAPASTTQTTAQTAPDQEDPTNTGPGVVRSPGAQGPYGVRGAS